MKPVSELRKHRHKKGSLTSHNIVGIRKASNLHCPALCPAPSLCVNPCSPEGAEMFWLSCLSSM